MHPLLLRIYFLQAILWRMVLPLPLLLAPVICPHLPQMVTEE
jgi:hypothetical protein